MNRFLMGLLLAAFVALSGCDDRPDVDADGQVPEAETTNVDADADTSADDSSGVSVKLPGVEINVDEEKGVEVKAPGTDVKVNKDGVDVDAPDVRIRTTPKSDN